MENEKYLSDVQPFVNVQLPVSDSEPQEKQREQKPEQNYLPQLLLLLQPDRLGWIGDLDFVVFTGADSGLGDLDCALQIGPPHTVHVPEQKHNKFLDSVRTHFFT